MQDWWFRFHNRARHSRKLNAISPTNFRNYVMFLTIASEHGGDIPDDFGLLGFELRIKPGQARDSMQVLLSVGLMESTARGFRPTKWDEMQSGPDTPAERMRRYRDNKALRKRNGDVTESSLELEKEKESQKEKERTVLRTVSKKARTQMGEWVPDSKQEQEAQDYWNKIGRHDLTLTAQLPLFQDYHKAKGSLMADWPAAWRTWYRNAPRMNRKPNGHGNGKADRPSAHRTFIKAAAELAGYDTGD